MTRISRILSVGNDPKGCFEFSYLVIVSTFVLRISGFPLLPIRAIRVIRGSEFWSQLRRTR
jgi:hypothetical protein